MLVVECSTASTCVSKVFIRYNSLVQAGICKVVTKPQGQVYAYCSNV
jgi:hypothetical protein